MYVPARLARPGQALAELAIDSGITTLGKTFIPGKLTVNPGATLSLAPASAVVTTMNAIAGTVELKSGSALSLNSDFTLPAGAMLRAREVPSLITCTGNWSCPGTFQAAGNVLNILTILQTRDGTIDHGANAADTVVVRTSPGYKTTWVSSNTIAGLTVATSTTLEVAAGKTLTIPGPIANAGLIIRSGVICHPAESLEALNALGVAVSKFTTGDTLRIRLRDGDEALSATAPDTAAGITLWNATNGDTLMLSAVETGAATTIFQTAAIATENAKTAKADGKLQCARGDVVYLFYTDSEDLSDNALQKRLDVNGPNAVRDWTFY